MQKQSSCIIKSINVIMFNLITFFHLIDKSKFCYHISLWFFLCTTNLYLWMFVCSYDFMCFAFIYIVNFITRMTTFIKTKFKKLDDQTNTDKYRVAANITKYHIISKLIFLRLIIPKFMKIKQLFHVRKCMSLKSIGKFWHT